MGRWVHLGRRHHLAVPLWRQSAGNGIAAGVCRSLGDQGHGLCPGRPGRKHRVPPEHADVRWLRDDQRGQHAAAGRRSRRPMPQESGGEQHRDRANRILPVGSARHPRGGVLGIHLWKSAPARLAWPSAATVIRPPAYWTTPCFSLVASRWMPVPCPLPWPRPSSTTLAPAHRSEDYLAEAPDGRPPARPHKCAKRAKPRSIEAKPPSLALSGPRTASTPLRTRPSLASPSGPNARPWR